MYAHNLTLFFLPKVTLGLYETSYTVNEGDSSVTVCIAVVNGTLDRVVQLTISTGDDGATDSGMYSTP